MPATRTKTKNGASSVSRRELTLRNKWAADKRYTALERRVQALERRAKVR